MPRTGRQRRDTDFGGQRSARRPTLNDVLEAIHELHDTARIAPGQALRYNLTRTLSPISGMVPAMKTAGDRLKWARESAGYETAADFARAHGIGEGGYRHHENGTRPIHVHVAKKYSKLLDIDAAWLLTGQGKPKAGIALLPNGKPLRLAPVISWVQAGTFGAADMDLSSENTVPIATNAKRIAAVEVLGTSMNRVAPPGAYIVLDYDDVSPQDGLLYVARIGDELTFKRFRDTNGPIRLEPDSTEPHDTIYPSEEWAIVARVIWVGRPV